MTKKYFRAVVEMVPKVLRLLAPLEFDSPLPRNKNEYAYIMQHCATSNWSDKDDLYKIMKSKEY